MDSSRWWRGVIRRLGNGQPIYIHALRSTAELYGWAEAFDARRPGMETPAAPDGRAFISPGWRNGHFGGRKHWISRHPNKNGKTRGCVNQFRLARKATYADIALVAAAVEPDWHWLTDKHGARVDRDVWLRAAQFGLPPVQP